MQESEPLPGGSTAPVVRVGNTVRRVAGPWTPQIVALMTGLRAAGVPYVPEHLGLDAQGREVVAYVEGDVPVYPMPAWLWDDAVLRDVGRAVRAVHDATPGLGLPRDGWRIPAVEPVEVVTHGRRSTACSSTGGWSPSSTGTTPCRGRGCATSGRRPTGSSA